MRSAASAFITALLLTSPSLPARASPSPAPPPAGTETATATPGYPIPKRIIGTPLDTQLDLLGSFPRTGAAFPRVEPFSGPIAKGKEWLYEKIGLQLSLSYQMLLQQASKAQDGDPTSLAGWLLFESRWELIDRKGPFKGIFVATVDWRHNLLNRDVPGLKKFDVGSLWLTDTVFFEWAPYPAELYWEQWLGKDLFVVRAGYVAGSSVIDFFRYKDPRVSFSGSPYAIGAELVPAAPPGPGLSFELWPFADGELYILGTFNDLNANPGRFDFTTLENGEFFMALETGYNWRRGKGDFDHAHVLVFYADARTTAAPFPTPAADGAGFKVRGTKQLGPAVLSASYTYNGASGGGFGLANARHGFSATGAWAKPLGVRGELALGLAWADPIDEALRDQLGAELYWRLLVVPNFWLTPGVQTILQPSFAPETDAVAIGQLNFRLVL